jgi:hypothetical protein
MRRRALASPNVVPNHPPKNSPVMMTRTATRTVRFARPFVLNGVEGEQPPGTYEVETEEELLPGPSFPVYRRIETRICLPVRDMGATGHHTNGLEV